MLNKIKSVISILIIIFTVMQSTSCRKDSREITLLTDNPGIAAAAEMYNAENPEVLITLHTVPFIELSVIESVNPDIIIGSYIYSDSITGRLAPLENLHVPEYGSISVPYSKNGEPLLIPLSFTMPVIMGSTENGSSFSGAVTVTPEELIEKNRDFIRYNRKKRITNLGFSPLWNPETGYSILISDYPEITDSIETPDKDKLAEVINYLKEWQAETAGSPEKDKSFNEKYRYIPDEILINEGRIQFAQTKFADWALLPDTIKNNLELRYLTVNGKIPVTETIYAGITAKGNKDGYSEKFLEWLITPGNQAGVIRKLKQDGSKMFGFLGGLSTIEKVNQEIICSYYPEFISLLPENYYIKSSGPYPELWKRITAEVIYPWIISELSGNGSEGNLQELYKKWNLTSLNYSF